MRSLVQIQKPSGILEAISTIVFQTPIWYDNALVLQVVLIHSDPQRGESEIFEAVHLRPPAVGALACYQHRSMRFITAGHYIEAISAILRYTALKPARQTMKP